MTLLSRWLKLQDKLFAKLGYYQAEYVQEQVNNAYSVAIDIHNEIVTKRDKIILERDEEIVKLQARLDALGVPAEEVPFCVDCHQGIKRGMPFHILTIRHGDCRFVGESKNSPASVPVAEGADE